MLRSSLLPLAAATAAFALPAAALADGVTITSYGHSALLINGGGASVLVNPFKAVACAAGLKEPRIKADVVLASSLCSMRAHRWRKAVFGQPGWLQHQRPAL